LPAMKTEYLYMNLLAPMLIVWPIVVAALRYKWLGAEAKILWYYLLLEAFVSLLSSTLAYQGITNLPLYHIAAIPETLLLGAFFLKIFTSKRIKDFIQWAVIGLTLFSIFNSLFLQGFKQLHSNTLVLQSGLIVFFSLWYLNNDPGFPGKSWAAIPGNLFVSGLLVYFSSSFILFCFSNQLAIHASKNMLIVLWNIHALLLNIMYTLFSVGFLKYKKDGP
jgi:hypothetical protein